MALNLDFTPEDERFRNEVQAFLSEHLTEELKREARRQTTVFPEKDVAMRWQRVLHEQKGWAAPSWPASTLASSSPGRWRPPGQEERLVA